MSNKITKITEYVNNEGKTFVVNPDQEGIVAASFNPTTNVLHIVRIDGECVIFNNVNEVPEGGIRDDDPCEDNIDPVPVWLVSVAIIAIVVLIMTLGE